MAVLSEPRSHPSKGGGGGGGGEGGGGAGRMVAMYFIVGFKYIQQLECFTLPPIIRIFYGTITEPWRHFLTHGKDGKNESCFPLPLRLNQMSPPSSSIICLCDIGGRYQFNTIFGGGFVVGKGKYLTSGCPGTRSKIMSCLSLGDANACVLSKKSRYYFLSSLIR
jgi:hypothetical protein